MSCEQQSGAEIRLARAIKRNRAVHAFFLSCSDPSRSVRAAMRTAALVLLGDAKDIDMLAGNPDFFLWGSGICERIGKESPLEPVNRLKTELSRATFANGNRVIVIPDAHNMDQRLQNSLLKLIEEPPERTYIIITGQEAGILPTIRSRCAIVRLGAFSSAQLAKQLMELGADEAQAKLYAAQSSQSFTMAERLYKEEQLRALRDSAQKTIYTLLMKGYYSSDAVKELYRQGTDAFTFMLSIMRDAMLKKLGEGELENPDKARLSENLAKRFTLGDIACIIDMLCGAQAETFGSNSGTLIDSSAVMRVFVELMEEFLNR